MDASFNANLTRSASIEHLFKALICGRGKLWLFMVCGNWSINKNIANAPFLNSSDFMVLWCKIMIFEVLIYNVSSYLMSKCYIKAFQTPRHRQGRLCSYLLLKSHHVHCVTHFSIFHTPGLNLVFLPKPAIQISDESKKM